MSMIISFLERDTGKAPKAPQKGKKQKRTPKQPGKKQTVQQYIKTASSYITNPEAAPENAGKNVKCIECYGLGFLPDVYAENGKINVDAATAEMFSTAKTHHKQENSFLHFAMSFKEDFPGETVPKTPEEVKEVVADALKRFGLEENQVLVGIHVDTEYLHAHILVNRTRQDGEFVRMGTLTKETGEKTSKYYDRAQEIIHEISTERGWHIHKNNTVEKAKRGDTKKIHKLDTLSPKASQYEAHTGKESDERSAKTAAKIVLANLSAGAGLESVRAAFAAQGLTFEEAQNGRGIVWTFKDRYHLKGSDLVSMKELAPFIRSAATTGQPATKETLAAVIASARQNATKVGSWPAFHRELAEHGIILERAGGTSRQGGDLRYVLADGSAVSGKDAGATLTMMESEFGATFRNVRKKERAELTALVAEAKGEKSTEVKTDATKTTTEPATTSEATKEAQAEKTAAAYEQGRELREKYAREEKEYFESARIARDAAKMVKKQGYNRQEIEAMLKKFGNSVKGAPTPEKMAIAAIVVLLKSLSTMRNDIVSLGGSATSKAKEIMRHIEKWQEEKAELERRAERVDLIRPDQKRAIYQAFYADTTKNGQNNPFLVSGGIATRLRLAGHSQTSIVEILKAGGEEDHLAETSGFYAFSEKGNQKFADQQKNAGRYERMDSDAKASCEIYNRQKSTSNAADNAALNSTEEKEIRRREEDTQRQTNNNMQNAQKNRKSHGMSM